jgi:hypothetical protein
MAIKNINRRDLPCLRTSLHVIESRAEVRPIVEYSHRLHVHAKRSFFIGVNLIMQVLVGEQFFFVLDFTFLQLEKTPNGVSAHALLEVLNFYVNHLLSLLEPIIYLK